MADMLLFLSNVLELFKIPMNIYGFVFSFWDIIMFTLFVGIIFAFFKGVLFD